MSSRDPSEVLGDGVEGVSCGAVYVDVLWGEDEKFWGRSPQNLTPPWVYGGVNDVCALFLGWIWGWGAHLGSCPVGVHGLDVEEDGLDLTPWFRGKRDLTWGSFGGEIVPILGRDTGEQSPFWGGYCPHFGEGL